MWLAADHFRNQPNNILAEHAAKKLGPKWLGPFKVLKVKGNGNALTLNLPAECQAHSTVNVSHVKECQYSEEFPDRCVQPPPQPIRREQGEFWKIEAFRKHRRYRGQLQYLVKWEGFGEEDNTWEPATRLEKDMTATLFAECVEAYRQAAGLETGFTERV